MRRFPVIGTLLLIPAVVMFMLTIGCDTKKEEKKKDGDPPPAGDKVAKKKIAGAPGATLTGVVKFDGAVPAPKENEGIKGHKESALCMAAKNKNDIMQQMWLVEKDGGVANVVISLVPAADKEYAGGVERKEKVFLDQPFCAYVPHVVAVQAGVQPLIVKNSGAMAHNTKIDGNPKYNEPTNEPVGAKEELKPKTFKFDPTPINIACSAHGFMSAKLVTFDHPYFAVTDSKGAFSIANIPVDEELTVFIWHESMGEKGKSDQKVTLKKGDTKSIELKIK